MYSHAPSPRHSDRPSLEFVLGLLVHPDDGVGTEIWWSHADFNPMILARFLWGGACALTFRNVLGDCLGGTPSVIWGVSWSSLPLVFL